MGCYEIDTQWKTKYSYVRIYIYIFVHIYIYIYIPYIYIWNYLSAYPFIYLLKETVRNEGMLIKREKTVIWKMSGEIGYIENPVNSIQQPKAGKWEQRKWRRENDKSNWREFSKVY